jgi:hypothetical protein
MKKHPAKKTVPKDCSSFSTEIQEALRRLIEVIARKMADEIVKHGGATNEAIEGAHGERCIAHGSTLAFARPSRNAGRSGGPIK